MSFKFEKLKVWQKSMLLGEEINQLANSFPKTEMYNLSSQARRAADSVALNIAEGCILQSNAEFRRFLGYSIRSIAEVVTCLYKAKSRNYINGTTFKELYNSFNLLMNMTIALRHTLKNK